MSGLGKWAAGIVAAIISGVVIYWLTTGLDGSDSLDDAANTLPPTVSQSTNGTQASLAAASPAKSPAQSPLRELSFLERVRGSWKMQSWTEAGGPVTLYIEVWNGMLTVSDDGLADWRMDLDQKGERHTPQPKIKCGGQTTLAGGIEGVPGGGRNVQSDWTSDLQSVDHSSTGENWIWRALCGFGGFGTRAPFTVTLGGPTTAPAAAMEMANKYGNFRWIRS